MLSKASLYGLKSVAVVMIHKANAIVNLFHGVEHNWFSHFAVHPYHGCQ